MHYTNWANSSQSSWLTMQTDLRTSASGTDYTNYCIVFSPALQINLLLLFIFLGYNTLLEAHRAT